MSCRTVRINGVVQGASRLHWDWGDGSDDQWFEASHEYSRDGVYRVRVTAYSPGGATEREVTVTIECNEPPVARLKASPSSTYQGREVVFDASGSYDPDGRVVEYFFDFGDGRTSGWIGEAVVSHSYGEEGTFTARVRVKDDSGALSEWESMEIRVESSTTPTTPNRTTPTPPNPSPGSGSLDTALILPLLIISVLGIAAYAVKRQKVEPPIKMKEEAIKPSLKPMSAEEGIPQGWKTLVEEAVARNLIDESLGRVLLSKIDEREMELIRSIIEVDSRSDLSEEAKRVVLERLREELRKLALG